ncbi:MAG: c-type cytochrome [Myxococcales bacterium FL481]|nr:MAG: c-type cytochrome [Myxococcales bacterium FL481]
MTRHVAHRNRALIRFVCVVLLGGAASCETYERPGKPDESKRSVAKAGSAKADGDPGLSGDKLNIDYDAVKAEGEKLYAVTCIGCHGPSGEGMVGIGPKLASATFLAAASDEMLVNTITSGRPGTTMAPWGATMQTKQVHALVGYLRSLAPHEPAALNESPLSGDVTRGQDVYARICSTCHGKHGAGYQESSSGTGIGRKAFLDTVSDGFMRHIIKNGKSGTKMRAFEEKAPTAVANLNDQEIEDVIAYLRSKAW